MTFPETLRPDQRRRHLADRRKAQEIVARDRRVKARQQCKEFVK